MPDQLCDAERTTGIAGGWLNPDLLERPFAEQSSVADAIERFIEHYMAGDEAVLYGFGVA